MFVLHLYEGKFTYLYRCSVALGAREQGEELAEERLVLRSDLEVVAKGQLDQDRSK